MGGWRERERERERGTFLIYTTYKIDMEDTDPLFIKSAEVTP